MTNRSHSHWYSDGKRLIGKLDHLVSRRSPPTTAEKEADWLGWDAWVCKEIPTQETHDTTHVA